MISPNSALPDETARNLKPYPQAVCPVVLPLARVKNCFLQLTVDPKANKAISGATGLQRFEQS